MIFNPTFYEDTGKGERGYDLFSRLLKDRVILLFNEITDDLACSVVAQLLYLESVDPDADISLYINSPGGSVTAGLAIYDTIQQLKCNVSTICVGLAASMGALLLAAGTPGKRYALANSQVMIHQVLGGTQGQASDIAIEAKHIEQVKARLNEILAKHTGRSLEEIEKGTDRNTWMFGSEAKAFGIVDGVCGDEGGDGIESENTCTCDEEDKLINSDASLLSLGLSPRSFVCLKKAGCITAGDALKLIEDGTIDKVKDLSKKSVQEVYEKLGLRPPKAN